MTVAARLALAFGLGLGLGVFSSAAQAQNNRATLPAQSSTNATGFQPGTNVSGKDRDCIRKKTGKPCPTDDTDDSGSGVSVFLPPLLADLIGTFRPTSPGGGGQPSPTDPGPRPPRVDGSDARAPAPQPPGGTLPRPKPTPPSKPTTETATPALEPPPDRAVASLPPAPQLPAGTPSNLPPRAVSGPFLADEVLAVIDGDAALAAAIAATNALEVISTRTSILLGGTIARFRIPDGRSVGQVLAQIEADGRAARSDPNHIFNLQQSASLSQYAFERIALKIGAASGRDVSVAVIDSAVEIDHPALKGVVVASHDSLPDRDVVSRDHGTSVVGLLAANGQIKGTAPGAAVYHSRAFEGGQSTMEAILTSLDWAAGKAVRVINMSFTGPRGSLMETACDTARSLGIVLVAAAGNNGPGAPRAYPAAFKSVIAVTATDAENKIMPAANRGSYIFLAAPGVDVIAPVPGGTDFLTGTSMASAILAGGIANLIRQDPARGPDWIERSLSSTAIDLGPEGRDADFGHGLANFAAADSFPTVP